MDDDFSEAAYLAANPDVAIAVARGDFRNGQHHYDLFGRAEGRKFPTVTADGLTAGNAQSGSWVWFTQPSAIRLDNGFLTSSVRRGQAGGETIIVRHSDGEPRQSVVVGRSSRLDDHDQAAFIAPQGDNRILAFFCHHTLDQYYLVRSRTADPKSAEHWEAPTDISKQLGGSVYTYAQPVQMADGTIYLFLRMQTMEIHTLHYSKSTDGGQTWATAKRILTGARPYFSVVRNGADRIDIACNDGHPNESDVNSLYHFYMVMDGLGGERFHVSDGKVLPSLPFTPSSHLTKVWDGSTPAGRSWIWHIGVDSKGHPALLYAVFPDRDTDHRYRRAVWTGARWDDREICAAGSAFADRLSGEFYYTGGCSFDPDDIDTIFASRLVGNARQIFRMSTHDGGRTWTDQQLTSGASNCVRPYLARGSDTLFYVQATAYRHYLDYEADLVSVEVTQT